MRPKRSGKLTRRDLGKVALAAASLPAIADAARAATPPAPEEAAEAIIERAIGRPIPEELRAPVQSAIKDSLATWSKVTVTLPDGSEPAFVFRPLAPLPQAVKIHGS